MDSLLPIPELPPTLPLFAVAAASLIVALFAHSLSTRLIKDRTAHVLATHTHHITRSLGIIIAILATIGLVPAPLSTVLPFIIIGVGVAAGWALKPVFTQIIAAGVVLLERKITVGAWVIGDNFSGEIAQIGVRSTRLIDRDGVSRLIPNQWLLGNISLHKYGAPLAVQVVMPIDCDHNVVRARLATMAKSSPWRSPNTRVTIETDPAHLGRYTVHLTVLKPTQSNRCAEALIAATRQPPESS